MKRVQGFDYRTDKPVVLTSKQWRTQLALVLTRGGRRVVIQGETLAIQDGRIVFEVYANIACTPADLVHAQGRK